jgi:uncharacterized membrane protein (UPF0182 family)
LDSFDKDWQRWFPQEKNESPASSGRSGCAMSSAFLILFGIIVIFIILNVSKGLYTEWLWFDSLSYSSVFSTILQTKVTIFFISAIIFGCFFVGNLFLAMRLSPKTEANSSLPWNIVNRSEKTFKLSVIIGTIVLSVIFGLVAQANWQIFLQFFNAQPFGVTDPVFNKEISFYVFSLPFFNFIRSWLLGMFILTFLGSCGIYLFSYVVQRLKFDLLSRPVLAHASGLLSGILIIFAWDYWLGIWELVFSTRGAIFGAGYTDIHAQLPAQWILLAVVIICVLIIIISAIRRNYRLPLYAIGGWVAASIIVGLIFPAIVQRFQVQPNELALETPYIEYNIQYTRQAFVLDLVEEQSFPAEDKPTAEDLAQNEVTINNIRLWDHRPLKDTYNQIQSIRLYYDFNDVDVDRYNLNGEYRQVMLSAREISAEKLTQQAQTWVNRQLQFTHGYGVVLSPVNEISTEGLPTLSIKDIPPMGDIKIERPQIYYGEKTNNYVIVKTNTQEFDFPMGDQNVYGHYESDRGVNLDSFIKRLAYAWQFGELNILISGELTPESSILYHRNIQERVTQLAPFLRLDSDPYIIVVDGKLLWIQDAYTVSNRYPYSEPIGTELNYIRNSVKVVIDAYNGDVTFYVNEPDDALIQTYQAIFPTLFTSIDKMPNSIREHLRYPEGLFQIQASAYKSYHMRDARVFYNKEDLWAIPKEIYSGAEQPIEPYYVIMRLPDQEEEEFLLMLPFTPVNKNNTIGWLAARCDGDNYGKLLAYFFPKERLVYGPSQIENRIQQDTTITEQFALWGRGGSRVIRGNLLFIPLGKSKLYVEPVFLQAEAGGLPELKRVIVAAGDQIAMEETLEESIAAIYGSEDPSTEPSVQPPGATDPEKPVIEPPTPSIPQEPGIPGTIDSTILIKAAQEHYEKAQQFLQEGNWAGYGEELDALKSVLDQLAELIAEEQ